MIRVENVSMRLGSTVVLQDVSLVIPKGGITALIGPNGAGKSSLLSLIARLKPFQSGAISIDGLPVDTTSGRELAKRIAILRQDTIATGRLRVRELIGFGRFPHSRGRLNSEDRAIVESALQRFDLADLADRFIETLSGGQRQRAFVAMTFAQDTDYLLLDEPLNNLDMYFARELMRSMRRTAEETGKTIVIVMHDINHAAAHADRIVALKSGRIVADGPPAAVITSETLRDIFGFEMQVASVGDTTVVLHFR